MDNVYEIWIFDRTPSGNQVYYPVEGGNWRVEFVEHSAAIPNQPTFSFFCLEVYDRGFALAYHRRQALTVLLTFATLAAGPGDEFAYLCGVPAVEAESHTF